MSSDPPLHSTPRPGLGKLGKRRGERLRRIARAAGGLLFPPVCANCTGDLESTTRELLICEACLTKLVPPVKTVCRRCAAPAPEHFRDSDCPLCRDATFHFESATALGVYRDELRLAVLRAKHPDGEPLARALGALIARRLAGADALPSLDAAVAMPMHWLRGIARGLNAAEVLASSIVPRLGLRPARDLLYFRRRIEKQSTLSPAQRFPNVRGSLAVSSAWSIEGAKLLLIDDILTTGATASEAAKVLKQAGAEEVHVAVVARGIGAL